MTGGSQFILITNTGKIDRGLYATEFLNARLEEFINRAKQTGDPEALPPLSVITQTHMLPVSSTFSPMVPLSWEYITTGITTGGGVGLSTAGNTTFQLMLASDFISDIKLSVRLPTVECADYATIFKKDSTSNDVFNYVHNLLSATDNTLYSSIKQKAEATSIRIGALVDNLESDETSPYGYSFGFSRKDGEIIPIDAVLTVPTTSEDFENGIARWYNLTTSAELHNWLTDASGAQTTYPKLITVNNIPLSKFVCDVNGKMSYAAYENAAEFERYFETFTLKNPTRRFRGQTRATGSYTSSNTIDDGTYKVKNHVAYISNTLRGLIKKVSFVAGNSELDSYDSFSMKVEQEMFTLPNKRKVVSEMIGQEQPITAMGPSYTINPIREKLNTQYPTTTGLGMYERRATSAFHKYWGSAVRQCYTLCGGLQTPETRKESKIISTNLSFWFCKSMSHALALVALPFGQKNINIEFNPLEHVLHEDPVTSIRFTQLNPSTAINFVSPITYDLNGNPATWTDDSIPNSRIIYRPIHNETRKFVCIDQPDVNLEICSAFTEPSIHLLYLKKVGFNLVTVHRDEKITISKLNSSNLIDISNALKWCVSNFVFAAIPSWNESFANPYRNCTWETPAIVIPQDTEIRHHTAINMVDNIAIQNDGDAPLVSVMPRVTTVSTETSDPMPAICLREYPIFKDIKFAAHNYDIRSGNLNHFDKYTGSTRGGIYLTPVDNLALVNFSLNCDPDQPSGSFNFSKSRSVNLVVTASEYANYLEESGHDTTINCHISGHSYNFILIAAGSATLRFAT